MVSSFDRCAQYGTVEFSMAAFLEMVSIWVQSWLQKEYQHINYTLSLKIRSNTITHPRDYLIDSVVRSNSHLGR